MPVLVAALTIVAAYLIGAIPFGYLVARMRGINIQEQGSGNIGATNVGRVLGRKFGLLVFVLDFAKGAGPVALALALKPLFDDFLWTRGFVEVVAGLTAFLGHVFPIYLRFHGGKGVATGFGAVFVLLPIPTLAGLFVWMVLVCSSRFMSLASIAAVFALCAAHLRQPSAWDWREPRTWFCLLAGALIVVRHHANLARLYHGTENQLKETIVMRQLCKSLHVLALGMWFGMSVFFTFVVALSLFNSFEELGEKSERETWLPQPAMYRPGDETVNGPKEQGVRVAGYAVGPIFNWYFGLQGLCGFVALATALPFMKFGGVHKWRVNLLLVAVVFVLLGWPLERHVTAARVPRNLATEAYLQDRDSDAKRQVMQEARAVFGMWHGFSLIANFATIAFVTAALALAGNLEEKKSGAGNAVTS